MDAPPSPRDPLAQAFDPEAFRALGHAAVDQLADYLAQVRSADLPVLTWREPDAAAAHWSAHLDSAASRADAPETLIAEILQSAFHGHHPRNLGHQVGPVLPLAAVFELVASLLDTGNGVYEVGCPATPMERSVLQHLAARIGMSDKADGVLTSGGSLGNLTAMLAMRQCQSQAWAAGNCETPCAVLVSAEAHYCIDRAVKIMGWGEAGAISVPVDGQFRLREGPLEAAREQADARGLKVIGVVASAGSTATGQIDPLPEIADFCQKHHLWLHVDAAHSGAFVFSSRARHLLEGLERADSVVIDFHKMLLSPSLLTAVLFKEGNKSFQTFAQKADYLWRTDQTEEWWDGAKRTVECTRPMLGLRAYALLRCGGEAVLENYIDRALQATHAFAALIEQAGDFETLIAPESNILCYRYRPDDRDAPAVDALNREIRSVLVREGRFYIVQIEKRGRTYLRSAVMNPFVTSPVFAELLDEIRRIGKTLC